MAGMLEGKVALVTGGGGGIGRATGLRYAEEGAAVVIADINDFEGQRTVSAIRKLGREALFVRADMTMSRDIQNLVEETVGTFGRLDAAFNNAGTPGRFTDVVHCDEDEWDFVNTLNLKSVWLCMKYEIPAMIASGGGAIVNTASEAANHPSPHMVSYVTTKAGVVGLTRSAALDFGRDGIRVNALLPGGTDTAMLREGARAHGWPWESMGAHLPLKRIAQAREQADVAVWLSSERASFVTGMAISVDGGLNLL